MLCELDVMNLAAEGERVSPAPFADPRRRPLPPDPSASDKRILVAEDNADMRRLIGRMLRRAGYEVIEATNGLELMHWVDLMTQWAPVLPVVDMVVTDLRMPMFSGLECIDELHAAGDRTPVILITAFGDERVHVQAREKGVRQVFDKPLDLVALRCAVVDILH